MSRHLVATAFGLCSLALGASGALAQSGSEPVVVVELYTSQGCSSCPPADDFLATLTRDPRILPLALHVDYWDYIGWADSFADPKFTKRQHAYARAFGTRMVYTPQMIVGGIDRVEGNNPVEVGRMIQTHLGADHPVVLTLDRQGDVLHIRAVPDQPLDFPLAVQLVRFKPEETVSIKRGENAGRTITYHNIVTSWERVGEWTGEEALDVEAAVPGDGPAVVILQRSGPAQIVAAARVD
jgi:hypothetical protein